MSSLPGLDNPFVYAQFRLNGGWRSLFTIGGIYAAIIASLIVVSTVNGGTGRSPFAAWTPILLALQMVALFVVGLSRVNAAVRGDVNTRMIESHRLMPVPPLAAVAGYVAGGSVFGLVLAAVNVLLGVGCCAAGGGDLTGFLFANAAVGLAAALVWFVAAHLAFTSRFGLLLLTGVSAAAFGFGNPTARVVPGFGLLTAAVTGAFSRDNVGSTNAYAVSLAALVVVAALCCRAAMRLYRSSDAIGITAPLGLGLLAVWTALSVLALGFPDLVYPDRPSFGSAADVPTQVVGTTVVGLLVATVPVAAACRAGRDRAAPPFLVPLAAFAMVGAVPHLAWIVNGHNPRPVYPVADDVPPVVVLTFAVVAAFVAAVTLLMHWANRRRIAAWPLAFLWVIAVWVGPVLVTAVVQATTGQHDPPEVLSLSTIGALTVLWTRTDDQRPLLLVLAQILLVALPAALYLSPPRRTDNPGPTAAAVTAVG